MPKWNADQRSQALSKYADLTGQMVFLKVPVTQPSWRGWSGGVRQRLESIAIEVPDGQPAIYLYEEAGFNAALEVASRVHPLLTWGYADRPGFGHLATRQQFLARTWRPNAPVQPVAVVAAGKQRPNVADVYFAAGFDILSIPDPEPGPNRRSAGAGGAGRNDPWTAPVTPEDQMLHELRESRDQNGWWLAEVPVGFQQSPNEASARRIDAVVIETETPRTSAGGADLDDLAALVRARAEVVEAKNHPLRTDVIGQVLCGRHMLAQSYPGLSDISMTVCVSAMSDDAMAWFCARAGIRVEVVEAMGLDRPVACPKCAATRILPIVYGLPDSSLGARAEGGELVLGGCSVEDGDPEWECQVCNFRWASEDR